MKRKSPSHSSSQFAFSSSFSSEPLPSSSDNPVEHHSNIRIAVRIRPESAEERTDKKHRLVVKAIDEKLLIFDPEERDGVLSGIPDNYNKPKDKKFAFDVVFDQYATQRQVYEQTTQSLIPPVLSGYNATVFAYGATGSGKTFTMIGTHDVGGGVMVLAMRDLFDAIHCHTHRLAEEREGDDKVDYKVEMTYLEIYNETVRDLLDATDKVLDVRENSKGDMTVSGLSLHSPTTSEEVFRLLEVGNTRRSMSPTDQNSQSSRSHAVLQIYVTQTKMVKFQKETKVGKLSLVDLAGSERAAVTTNRAQRLVEGANINRSLLALANCINALASGPPSKKKFVPFRDSKLTRLLKDSLGGNCLTVMIANVSPSSLSYDDTHNTLKYADRAKQIKCDLRQNSSSVKSHISDYKNLISQLHEEIHQLRSKIAELSSNQSDEIERRKAFHFHSLYSQLQDRGTALLSCMKTLAHIRHEQCLTAIDFCRKSMSFSLISHQHEELRRGNGKSSSSSAASPPTLGRIRTAQHERDGSLEQLMNITKKYEESWIAFRNEEHSFDTLTDQICGVSKDEHRQILHQTIESFRLQMDRLHDAVRFERVQFDCEYRAIQSDSLVELFEWEASRNREGLPNVTRQNAQSLFNVEIVTSLLDQSLAEYPPTQERERKTTNFIQKPKTSERDMSTIFPKEQVPTPVRADVAMERENTPQLLKEKSKSSFSHMKKMMSPSPTSAGVKRKKEILPSEEKLPSKTLRMSDWNNDEKTSTFSKPFSSSSSSSSNFSVSSSSSHHSSSQSTPLRNGDVRETIRRTPNRASFGYPTRKKMSELAAGENHSPQTPSKGPPSFSPLSSHFSSLHMVSPFHQSKSSPFQSKSSRLVQPKTYSNKFSHIAK